ncbi:hypothetical protein ABN028_12020 [Actinopolymorpha sp. B17G11]|uniref:hypothetical protein n=1 Tax=Actinopolymorpha sp. B17G11 TaxID=3160861 RepID=UPI0032E4506B
MRDTILAALGCSGAVLGVSRLWLAGERVARVRWLATGYDLDLARLVVALPLMWLISSALLWYLDVPRPGLVPVLAAGSAVIVSACLGRLLFLGATVVRLTVAGAALLVVMLAAGWWAWAAAPGRSWSLRFGLLAALGALAVCEWWCAGSLDVAVKRREILSTGVRPIVVEDPAWELDYVYVSPDRRYVSVGYENPGADNSLSVDLLGPVGGPAVESGPVEGDTTGGAGARHGTPAWTGFERNTAQRFLVTVGDQLVRLEFDHGDVHEDEVARLSTRMRQVDAGELALRDAARAR